MPHDRDITRKSSSVRRFTDYFTDTEAGRGRSSPNPRRRCCHQLRADAAHAQRGAKLLVSFNAAIFKDQRRRAVRGIFASRPRHHRAAPASQEQLREQQTYNRGLIEASVDGLVTVDDPMGASPTSTRHMCRHGRESRAAS